MKLYGEKGFIYRELKFAKIEVNQKILMKVSLQSKIFDVCICPTFFI